jgi:hypothetical protein
MKKLMFALGFVLLVPLMVRADNLLVSIRGGIGVDPVSGISSGAPVANTVCGVAPGGLPWRIAHLHAEVSTDGHIDVDGRGLLLAGGNVIATNGGQSVRAELFCNTNASSCGTGFVTNAGGVALDANGDFKIDDTLSPTPLPDTCTTPVFLIVSATNGHWFAAGIPSQPRDH